MQGRHCLCTELSFGFVMQAMMGAAASTWAPHDDVAQHLQQLQVGLPVSNRLLLVTGHTQSQILSFICC